jgi:TRAP-type C4-dicarboxylate transport system substrate-binding protein
MKITRLVVILVSVLLVYMVIIGCSQPASAPPTSPASASKTTQAPATPVTLRLVTWESKSTPTAATCFPIFAEEVAKASGGLLKIDWVGGPEVMPPPEQPQAVSKGLIDIFYGPGTMYSSQVPENRLLPFSYISYDEEVKRGYDKYMDKVHREKMNAVWVGRMLWGFPFHIATKYPIKTPADFKGHKVAVSPTTAASSLALGLIPIETEEEYTALERGVTDTVYSQPASMAADGIFEVATHFIDHPLGQGALIMIASQNKFNSLPANLQNALLQGHLNARPRMTALFKEQLSTAIGDAKKAGLTMVKFSPEDAALTEKTVLEAGWKAAADKLTPESLAKMRELCGR